MSNADFTLSELIELAKNGREEDVDRLTERIDSADLQDLRNAADSFDALFEIWEDQIAVSEEKAKLCIKLADLSALDTPNFRSALQCAVRKLLPPYLTSGQVVKAVGARDAKLNVHEVAARLKKLQRLRSTAVLYHHETHQCGKINGIDKVTGTIAVVPFRGASVSSLPISSAVANASFFDTTPDLLALLYPAKGAMKSSAEYRRILKKNALSEVPETTMRDLVFHLAVPGVFTAEEFQAWWNASPIVASASPAKRTFADSRSVLELFTLLKPYLEKGDAIPLDAAAAEKLKKLFSHLRNGLQPKEAEMLAESISALANSTADSATLADMFAPLRGRMLFWPADVSSARDVRNLDLWARFPVKFLPGFIKAARLLYSDQEIVLLGLRLPIRCMNVLFEDKKLFPLVTNSILNMKSLSPDVILWIWKNRKELPSMLTTSIDMEAVANALNLQNLPKEWAAAQRELRKTLHDKADFQKFLIENADCDIPSIISSLQKYREAQPGERQSIMVKLARHSADLKACIESGEGRKLMGGAAKTKTEQPPMTSVASHKRLADELQDLIENQIPQNAAAVAYARSFGDLRENAEYDAAKERRRYLHRRRADLEKILGYIESVDFRNVKIEGHVVPGCRVSLEKADGTGLEYYVLGAWDGDPERGRISYTTRAGAALIDRKVGDKVEIPDAGVCVVRSIDKLPDDMLKELAGE